MGWSAETSLSQKSHAYLPFKGMLVGLSGSQQ
jgi:hypothetical protein